MPITPVFSAERGNLRMHKRLSEWADIMVLCLLAIPFVIVMSVVLAIMATAELISRKGKR